MNKFGKVPFSEIKKILNLAKKENIYNIDTAMAYGNSEEILGKIGIKNFRVTTKLKPSLHINEYTHDSILNSIEKSLRLMGIAKIHGILVHNADFLKKKTYKDLIKILNKCKEQGVVKKIGVSIYSPMSLEKIISEDSIDIVQSPISLFDQRLIKSGWLEKLNHLGVEVHARSIFLQGLLLQDIGDLPRKFVKWKKNFINLSNELKEHDITPLNACLNFIMNNKKICKTIIGIDSYLQLKSIISSTKLLNIYNKIDWEKFAQKDTMLLNPYMWDQL